MIHLARSHIVSAIAAARVFLTVIVGKSQTRTNNVVNFSAADCLLMWNSSSMFCHYAMPVRAPDRRRSVGMAYITHSVVGVAWLCVWIRISEYHRFADG